MGRGRGRPRKSGARGKTGRLLATVDHGNDRVQARAALYGRFQDGKAEHQVDDQIGRAWAAGLLDGTTVDAAILRDIGRRYAALYWQVFVAMAPKMGATERRDRSSEAGHEDPTGEQFRRLDDLARSAGRDACRAMHKLCVDDFWFPDADSAWLIRMVSAVRSERPQTKADTDEMRLAVTALVTMVDGRAEARVRKAA